MRNSRYCKLLSVSLLVGQLLFVGTSVRADESNIDENFPEPLQGSISEKANLQPNLQGVGSFNRALPAQATSHLLFGNVEQKDDISLPAHANGPPHLMSLTPKLAPTGDQMHRLSAQTKQPGCF